MSFIVFRIPLFGVDPVFCNINRDLQNFTPLFTYSAKKVLLDGEVSSLKYRQEWGVYNQRRR